MQRVKKMVAVPFDVAEGHTGVTVAVLDTGERVA